MFPKIVPSPQSRKSTEDLKIVKGVVSAQVDLSSKPQEEETKDQSTYFKQPNITNNHNKELDQTTATFEEFPFELSKNIKEENRNEISLNESLEKINTAVYSSTNKQYLASLKFIKSQVKKMHNEDLNTGAFRAYLEYKLRTKTIDLNCINIILADRCIMTSLSMIVNDKVSLESLDRNMLQHELALSSEQPKFITDEQLYGKLENKAQYISAHKNLHLTLDSSFMTESLDLYEGHECLYSDIGLKIEVPDSFKDNTGFFKLDKDFYYGNSQYQTSFTVTKLDLRTALGAKNSYLCFSTHKDEWEGLYRRSFSGARYIQFQAFNSKLMEKVIAELFNEPSYIEGLYNTEYKLHESDCHTFCQQIREKYINTLVTLGNSDK